MRAALSHQVISIDSFPSFDVQVSLLSERIVVHLSFDLTFIDAGSVTVLMRVHTTHAHGCGTTGGRRLLPVADCALRRSLLPGICPVHP